MSRSQEILKFLEKGGSGTDAELAKRFAKEHAPKRGAEIVRSTICALNKGRVSIVKRNVEGQRKQEYYIFGARTAGRPAPASKTTNNILNQIEIKTIDGQRWLCCPLGKK